MADMETIDRALDAMKEKASDYIGTEITFVMLVTGVQKAHTANNRAVMQAYGFSVKDMSEADCVAALMKMYQELTIE